MHIVIMCVILCLFSAPSHRVHTLQISIIIIRVIRIRDNLWFWAEAED